MSSRGAEARRATPEAGGGDLQISQLSGVRDLRDWLDLPERVQGRDPHWVAPLRLMQRRLLDRRANPFFKRAEAEFFIARRGGRPVGRISAHRGLPLAGLDHLSPGTFGFFECADDPAAADRLLAAAERWLAARGALTSLGPMNFSMNMECGLLIEGSGSPPFVLMGHNPPRYAALIEQRGYRKIKDLYAYRFEVGPPPEGLIRLAEHTRRRSNLRVRHLDLRRFERDVRAVFEIFNKAWRDNWGFTPMLEDEFDEAVREMRRVAIPELILLVEKDERPVAIAVSLPNLNEALAGLKGRLFPLGLIRLLWRLKVRRPRTARCLMLGIDPSARGLRSPGLLALLLAELMKAAVRAGIRWGELSWTLEDNDAINRSIEAVGGVRYKTYRIYSREISP